MNQELSVIPAEQSGPMVIIQAAIASGAAMDVDRLAQLMEMQFKWDKEQARKQYFAAMIGLKKLNLIITHDKKVGFETKGGKTSYTHASLGHVCDSIVKAAAEHGFSHSWATRQEGSMIRVTCMLTHAAGHTESESMEAPPDASGGKNSIQQIKSTITYLQRSTLLAVTGTATTDDDDGRGAGGGDEEPKIDVRPYIAAVLAIDKDDVARDYYRANVKVFDDDKVGYKLFRAATEAHRTNLQAKEAATVPS